jgi:hypothetical protein
MISDISPGERVIPRFEWKNIVGWSGYAEKNNTI